MFTTLLAACSLGLAAHAPAVFDLEPSDNVWVYAHAPNSASDLYLRAWGAEGKSVAPNGGDAEEFSYSYLKWDLSSLPKDRKLVEAKLILTHIPNPGYPLDFAKANRLEARALSGDFTEKTWGFESVAKIFPVAGKEGLLGSAAPDLLPPAGEEFKIVIDLGRADAFAKSLAQGGSIGLALTTMMEPQAIDGKSIYKVYSRHAAKEKRPVLHLVFAG